MFKLPIVAALLLSAAAGYAVAGIAMPPLTPAASAASAIQVADCRAGASNQGTSSRHVRRQADCDRRQVREKRVKRRQFVDCHRDVRRHRVGGIMLRHRHVGADCAIREVRGSN